jgi:proline racemase
VLESPAGLIRVHSECRDGKVVRAKLYNQPAFAYYLDEKIDVRGLGSLKVDVAGTVIPEGVGLCQGRFEPFRPRCGQR